MYNCLINRFPSPDPLIIKGQQYPELSPYQFASNSPVFFIDLDGLEGVKKKWSLKAAFARKTAQEVYADYTKKHGKVTNAGGIEHRSQTDKKNSSTEWIFKEKIIPVFPEESSERAIPNYTEDVSNPLTPLPSSNAIEPQDNEAVYYSPSYSKGNIVMSYTPMQDENGKNKESTYEIGVIDAEGKETPLVKTRTDQPGAIQTNFDLKEGEVLYERSNNIKLTHTTATKAPSSDQKTNENE